MLVANMLQNVCGCNRVEGFMGSGGAGSKPDMTKIGRFIVDNQPDSDACGGFSDYSDISDKTAEGALKNFCSQENVNDDGALQDFLDDPSNSYAFGDGTCTAVAIKEGEFDSSCISSGLSSGSGN